MLTSVYSDRIRGKVVLTLAAMVTACVAFAPWTGRTELASLPVWRSLTRFDGLASENVRDIASDIDGGLWFATSAGLSRFDGLWTTFTRVEGLPSNDIRALAPVGDNDLWIATAAGVSHLRRSSPGAWDIELADTALPGVEVFDVVVARNADRPSVWAGTRDGLHAFTDGRWTQFAPTAATPVRVLASDVNGFLWCARDRRGEEPYAVLRVPAVGAPPDTFPLPDSLGAAAVRAIFSPDPGTLWVGTSAGLLELDGDWSEPLFPPGVVDVTGFTRHPDGSLWIATSRGVFRHGTEWTQFGTEHGFPVPPIRAIHVEPTTGSVWVSTPAGVAHARGPWSRLSALTGLPTDSVRHVVADLSGNVWAATPVGLLQLSADAIALYGVETGLPSARIRAVAVAPDGRVWAGSDGARGGLAIPEGETFRTLRAADGIGESNEVYSIAFDSRG
ncbi:hypothetical protein FJZ36_14305, partial [Candidatus Poribacteria bacterium]|nr:hypothetical protein [Candidatus Poribacteria bacterium]